MKIYCLLLTLWHAPVLAFATENFAEVAWRKSDPIYQAIKSHPFNHELAKGSLDPAKFAYYQDQDKVYLETFCEALTLLSRGMDDEQDKALLKVASDGCDAERSTIGVGKQNANAAPMTVFYTNFILTTAAFRGKPELAAALLPCFYLYLKLAEDLNPDITTNNPFGSWFKLYTSEKYRKAVAAMTTLTNRLASRQTSANKQKMLSAYMTAMRLEWYFWNGAYTLEQWRP